jgi:hypothetical protein
MTSGPVGDGGRGKGFLGRVAGAVTERVVETVDPDIVLEHVDLNALLDAWTSTQSWLAST